MANYLLVYHGGTGMPESETEQAAIMQAWGAWFGGLGEAVVDGGAPTAQSKTINNGSVSDGAGATPLTGYSILAADSLDTAVTMAKGCPVLEGGGTVNVYETVDIQM